MKLSGVLAVAMACLVGVAGCGGGNGKSKLTLVKVTGTVKFDGKPLPQGTISFVGTGEKTTNAAGEIDSSGHYTLSTQEKGDGIPAGSYKVRIESMASLPKMTDTGVEPGKSAIPERYNKVETSELTATVNSGKSQAIDFNLTP